MARSRLRENQVQDVDFLSEEEHTLVPHTFEGLSDVPTLSGNEGKYLRVDSTASGIEYVSTAGDVLVDRGDPADYDFTTGNFTTDDNWHDLDLSSIVPSGATWVKVKVVFTDDAVDSYLALRKNGNTNTRVSLSNKVRVANKTHYITGFVPCDSNRVIEYIATNTTFTTISLVVTGWVLPGSVNDALKTDGTAGRVYRACYIRIQDGTNANTIKCTVFNRFNGDTFSETDNIGKGDTSNNFNLSANGQQIYLKAAGLSGNALHAMGCLIYAIIGVAAPACQVKANTNDIRINMTNPVDGSGYDLTSLVDTGDIYIDYFYITDE